MALYFITQAGRGYIEDDHLLVAELQKLGIRPTPLPWTEGLRQVQPEDVLVIRAIWDYHLRPRDFISWLEAASLIGCIMINSVPLLRWNHKKTYLQEMLARGVLMPHTLFFSSPEEFAQGKSQLSPQREYVLKPIISASAHGTFRVPAEAVARAVQEFPYAGFLIQEFLPEIEDGEWSLIFIGGQFTHAVKKLPRPGEFRIQSEFGGRVLAQAPPSAARAQAERIIDLLPETPIYARIDVVMRGDQPLLIEIELIEPDLFLSTNLPAAGHFARLICAALGLS